MATDELLTSTETARLLRVHPKHLYRLLRQGLPGHRVGRGHWRFKRTEVLAWLKARGQSETGGAIIEVRLADAASAPGRCFLGRIADRWVGHVADPDHPHAADALVVDPSSATARVEVSRDLDDLSANVLVAGCAPLLGPLLDRLERRKEGGRVHWLAANSTRALQWLADGYVHAAGIHLGDEERGLDNAAIVRRTLPRCSFHLVHLVRWRQGLAVTPRNPKGIRSAEDLVRNDVRVATREKGSGARQVLDRALRRAKVTREQRRAWAVFGDHRSVARAVAFGTADVGVTVESAALELGLEFVPLAEEAFDLVVPADIPSEGPILGLLERLDDASVRREIACLGPYDARYAGHVQALAGRPA